MKAVAVAHTHETRIVSTTIAAPWRTVYDFARQPENLPRWASGLATGVYRQGDAWFTDSPMGRVQVKMAEDNAYGVLDHDVILPSGQMITNAMRVVPNGEGCTVLFVLCRLDGVDEAAFANDAAHVERDLLALQRLF